MYFILRYDGLLSARDAASVADGKAGLAQMLAYGWGVPQNRASAYRTAHEVSNNCSYCDVLCVFTSISYGHTFKVPPAR